MTAPAGAVARAAVGAGAVAVGVMITAVGHAVVGVAAGLGAALHGTDGIACRAGAAVVAAAVGGGRNRQQADEQGAGHAAGQDFLSVHVKVSLRIVVNRIRPPGGKT